MNISYSWSQQCSLFCTGQSRYTRRLIGPGNRHCGRPGVYVGGVYLSMGHGGEGGLTPSVGPAPDFARRPRYEPGGHPRRTGPLKTQCCPFSIAQWPRTALVSGHGLCPPSLDRDAALIGWCSHRPTSSRSRGVVLQRRHIVRTGLDNLPGEDFPAAHGVDRDRRPPEGQANAVKLKPPEFDLGVQGLPCAGRYGGKASFALRFC